MTIIEFLLARIADDELVARDWLHLGERKVEVHGGGTGYAALVNPNRFLAECEAKRRIAELHKGDQDDYRCIVCAEEEPDYRSDGDGGEFYDPQMLNLRWPCPTLRALAAVYADHPDYDESWRP